LAPPELASALLIGCGLASSPVPGLWLADDDARGAGDAGLPAAVAWLDECVDAWLEPWVDPRADTDADPVVSAGADCA
jgi:hypothetical protein